MSAESKTKIYNDELEGLSANELFELLDLEEALETLQSKKYLSQFVRTFFPVIERGSAKDGSAGNYVHGWHVEAICDHLEALYRGEIRRLIINIPPRHMKSTIVSVSFPAWAWLQDPSLKFLFASYSQTLSTRDALKTRTLIESPEFKKIFSPPWGLAEDQNTKARYNTTSQGFRFSSSVGGSVTGEGGDFIVVDDPHNAVEIESEAKRESVLTWWDTAMSSRLNDPKTGRMIVVMQRLHEKDLTGHLLSQGGWEHLKLPAEYEGKPSRTKIGFTDPRKENGELLWPDRFGPDEVKELKKMGARAASAQLQQDPTPATAALFSRDYWQYLDAPPEKFLRTVTFWDTASKPGISNDYTIGATWGEFERGFFLIDLFRGRLAWPALAATVRAQYAKHTPNAVVIEDKGSGISLIQDLRATTRIPVIPFDPGQRDKVVRASASTPLVESGRVFLPRNATWVEDFLTEHEKFPNGEFDDIVDTTSMMADFFRTPRPKPSVRLL